MIKRRILDDKAGVLHRTLFWMVVQGIGLLIILILGLYPGYYFRQFFNGYHTFFMNILGFVFIVAFTAEGCASLRTVTLNSKEWWKRIICMFLLYISLFTAIMFLVKGNLLVDKKWYSLFDIWILPLLWVIEMELIGLFLITLGNRRSQHHSTNVPTNSA